MHEDCEEYVSMFHHLRSIQFSIVIGGILGTGIGAGIVGLIWLLVG